MTPILQDFSPVLKIIASACRVARSVQNDLQNLRQLTTVFRQTRGVPVALKDGTVIVIHDTRYGPGPAGSRAMISRDEGKTWEDEVYYLDHTAVKGS